MKEHLVDVGDGTQLFAVERGEGPPVVLQPGLGYAAWCWEPLMERLADRHRVIAVDTRGAGRSDKPEGPYTIELLAADLAAVIGSLDAAPAHLVGHSLGGYVAQVTATRHAGVVCTITLIGTSPGGDQAHPVPPDTMDAWMAASQLEPAEYARRTFAMSFSPGWADANEARFGDLLAARLEFPTPQERWQDHWDAGSAFMRQGWDVEEISVPTLIVHGGHDRVVPPDNGRLLHRRIPDSTLELIHESGHNVILEHPDEVAALIDEFVASHPCPE